MADLTTLYARVSGRQHQVTSWNQVSTAYRKAIEQLGLGASQAPRCEIVDHHGRVVAHVSCNGRVWPGATWTGHEAPFYVPKD